MTLIYHAAGFRPGEALGCPAAALSADFALSF